MSTDNHNASDRNKVIIAEIRKLVNELEGNVIDKNPIAELGETFYDWAEEFFSPTSGRLNCYVPLLYAIKEYQLSVGLQGIRVQVFRRKVETYASIKGLSIPAELKDQYGRLTRKFNDIFYDAKTSGWIKLGGTKTQSMIYLHTPGSDITDRIYDPTVITGEFESVGMEDQHRPHLTTKVQIPD